ncbi:MAG: AAA family ATPase, partial [Deltaproteobacteria bacterium]|nr:AAA family ATPase [Deltaproteobacteria bacterium]
MQCPECHSENREGVKFCEECGAKMEMECPNCGSKIPLGKKFCGECGQKLAPKPETPPLDLNKPESYTPKFMAEKILTTRTSIEGEHKSVTVLFSDVAGYTSMSENLDPEEVHQIMDGCFRILMDEIHKYEGTINQFTGDGVMALFGAPLAHEDHAQRACCASLGIQRALEDYRRKIEQEHGTTFHMRIGLNSGPVVVGAIGDDLRMDYTAIGDTTNLGARMESLAEPGTIYISKNTQRLVKNYFKLKSLGRVEIKGKAEPQEIFELIDASDVMSRLDASSVKGLTRYVGRGDEMGLLLKTFARVREGSGQIVGIIGEAGVGKSRFVLEFQRQIPEGYRVLNGRCIEYGSSIPFLPILEMLKSYFGIDEGDREENDMAQMKEKLVAMGDTFLAGLPAYADLLSLPVQDRDWVELDPKLKREKTFEAMRDLIIRIGDELPLILVVDDLQWIDKTSEAFLDYLTGWLAQAHVMLLLLYRPEYTHPWGSKTYYHQIGLDQLPLEKSADLVQSILGDCEVAPDLKNLILNRAAGNPLFMEELTYTLLDNGSIEMTDNACRLSARADKVKIPDTIQGIISARMDRLEDDIKRTMQVASVIGRDFAFRILQWITGLQDDLKVYLLKLQGLEFIYEKRLFPELEYIFKHAITQEVAYNSLLLSRRKGLHKSIGLAMEQIYGDRIEEFLEVLAYHFSRSDDYEKAYHYLKLSGDKAIRKNSASEALEYCREAMRAAKAIPVEADSQI